MHTGNVCVIGNNTMDLVFAHSKELSWGEKQNADQFQMFPGGQGANTAFTLAALGIPTSYIGYFGDDQYGDLSKRSLTKEGIDISQSLTARDCSNHIAAIFVDTQNHSRTIMMYRDHKLSTTKIAIHPSDIQNYRAVYNDGHEPEISIEVSKLAQTLNIPVVTDVEIVTPEILELLKYTVILIAPLKILKGISSESTESFALEKVSALGPSIVLSTRGSEGSTYFSQDIGHVSAPAEHCIPLDTTGAGDAFHAGFLAAQLSGIDIAQSLKIASKIAALKCECFGPRLSGKQLEIVKNWNFPQFHHE